MRVLPTRQGTSCRQAGCSQRLPKLCPMLGSLDLSRSQSIVGMVLSISTGPGTACLRPACLLLAHEFGNLTMLILGGTSTDSAICDGRTLGRTLTPVLSRVKFSVPLLIHQGLVASLLLAAQENLSRHLPYWNLNIRLNPLAITYFVELLSSAKSPVGGAFAGPGAIRLSSAFGGSRPGRDATARTACVGELETLG